MATTQISQKSHPVLWLATDEAAEPYTHHVGNDECDCKTCESKKSHLILEQ